MKDDFIPPVDNPIAIRFFQSLIPLALRMEKLRLNFMPRGIESIRNAPTRNVVLMLNHSDRSDPTVAFALSQACGEDFYYLAARELFDLNFGIRGLGMQHCGTYSVIRGQTIDSASAGMTRDIIRQGRRKLVMFPEGDVTGRDDEILPLKEDGILNILSAQERLLEEGREQAVYLLPTACLYEVPPQRLANLETAATRLENHLGLLLNKSSLESRILAILGVVIEHLERYYSIDWRPNDSLDDRLSHLCRNAISHIADVNGVEVGDENEAIMLYNTREKLRHADWQFDTCTCNYCGRLSSKGRARANSFITDLDRIQQLLIIKSTIGQQPFTLEVCWRLIDRLEFEILGKPTDKGYRYVRVDTGPAINLLPLAHDFKRNKEQVVSRIDRLVRTALLDTLNRLKNREAVAAF